MQPLLVVMTPTAIHPGRSRKAPPDRDEHAASQATDA
jgi:hypothetical protein